MTADNSNQGSNARSVLARMRPGLFLLLLIGVSLVAIRLVLPDSWPRVLSRVNPLDDAPPSEHNCAPVRLPNPIKGKSQAGSTPNTRPGSGVDNCGPSQAGKPDSRPLARMVFKDPDGNCVEDFPILFQLCNEAGKFVNGNARSGADGTLAISGHEGDLCRIRAEMRGYYIRSFQMGVTATGDARQVTVWPTRTLKLQAVFADGQPYIYDIGIGSDEYRPTVQFPTNGVVEVPGVPLVENMTCIFYERRVGYARHVAELPYADRAAEKSIYLVVPKATNVKRGAIELSVDCPELPVRAEIKLTRELGADSGISAVMPEGKWTSSLLPPGKYKLTVIGPWAGETDWLEVVDGEITRVHLRLQCAASVRVRILDESGAPIRDSVLRRDDGTYMSFDGHRLHPQEGDWAVADKTGDALLGSQPAGDARMLIEAPGYEIQVRQVKLASDAEHDLGKVVLCRAQGKVTVRITGARAGLKYAVLIYQPQTGPPILPRQTIAGDAGTVEHLPLREYAVCVCPYVGGDIAVAIVNLTERDPTAEVELDVAKLQPDESQPK